MPAAAEAHRPARRGLARCPCGRGCDTADAVTSVSGGRLAPQLALKFLRCSRRLVQRSHTPQLELEHGCST